MLDPQLLRTNLEYVQQQLLRRNFVLDIDLYQTLEGRRKGIQVKTQALQQERNQRAKTIGQAKAKGEDIQPLLQEVEGFGEQLKVMEAELGEVQLKLNEFLMNLPNILDDSVPDGKSEEDNKLIYRSGSIPQFGFRPKDHVELGERLGMRFDQGSKITGARFVVLKGVLARLQRAIIQFMLDTHIDKHGYQETYVPFMVNSESLRGTGQLPKFEADLFKLEGGYYLIPTAEVPVTNLVRDEIIEGESLKYVCHTPCFRSEAGAHGSDTRGMIRQHQFEKVELVKIVRTELPESSDIEHESLTQDAENILKMLGLPYQKVLLCAGDTGFSSAKTYDLEVWLPGQDKYREISSCSNFKDFQARRMQARWRNPATGKPELVHTLNGSGLAAGRTLIAIMENYQNEDGSIRVPDALKGYMGGLTVIG